MNHTLAMRCAWLLLVCLSCFCCDRASKHETGGSYRLRGRLENKTSGWIFLSTSEGDEFILRDSSAIRPDGSFLFEGKMSPGEISRLSLDEHNGLFFVLDAGAIDVSADANDLAATGAVQGSPESGLLRQLMDAVEKTRREQSALERQFAINQIAGNSDSLLYLQESFLRLQARRSRDIKDFIRENPRSFVAAFAASALLDRREEQAFIDSMLTVFNETIPDSRYVRELNTWSEGRISLAPGAPAPEIELPQMDGTPLALSSLRGKYVLIDFWASWCGPCRKENPEVVRLYNRYNDKGFEIYGVSLDESRDQWRNAIQQDGLPWRHVCDLKGAAGVAVQLYDVQTIPKTLLLDREGQIIAQDLRGAALAEKLRELFPE
ncbi:MAG TPA: TlpA disulfide reductase family protein [Chryseosolibacter sp.]